MSSLVLELQADAINREVSCSDLLRKALVVSKKLEVDSIENWLYQELNGYSDSSNDKIPDYRIVRGQVKALNPYHGYQPVYFENRKVAERLRKRKTVQPIVELIALLENREKGSLLHFPLPQNIAIDLMADISSASPPTLEIPYTEIVRILDTVRNKVLEWALELEKKGIMGKGMTFSKKEREAADQVTYQTITNIGSMQNSQLLQNSPSASQNFQMGADLEQILAFIEEINTKKEDLGLDEESAKELQAEISTITTQSSSPKPKPRIITEALESIRSILKRVTDNVATSVLLAQIEKLL